VDQEGTGDHAYEGDRHRNECPERDEAQRLTDDKGERWTEQAGRACRDQICRMNLQRAPDEMKVGDRR
jgi:hypothetical protein